jgi:triphosphoribosyl-dephospho-CoA synthetase
MESAMFAATQNTNTQKGVIFLMGLSLFACGKLFSQSDQFSSETFRAIIQGICKDLVKKEFVPNSGSGKSHGEEIFLKYGSGGARGEAESGFRMVFEFGLPQLAGFTQLNDESLIKCFLAIAANNNDTNILYRSNPQVLSDFKKHCKNALENFSDENYAEVIDYCKNKNISPGGSADLLAVTIFVWSVMRQFDNSTM